MAQVPRFVFDDRVAMVFDNMIRRSVPGYAEVLAVQANLIPRIHIPNRYIYDLGCSTANLFALLQEKMPAKYFVGVDPSQAMLTKAQEHFGEQSPIRWICDTAENCTLDGAGIVVMNFVLQFLDPQIRTEVLNRIYEALPSGGYLLLSEKVRHKHPFLSQLEIDVHHDHKRHQGYSDLEIQQKRDAIDDYLRPDSLEFHLARLGNIGFTAVDVVFKWMNFCSLIAIKE